METVHELLESRRRDGAPALIDAASGETLVGTALAARVAGRARALVAAGVRPGDRVALLVPNSLACAETLLAAATAGAAAVPINQIGRASCRGREANAENGRLLR